MARISGKRSTLQLVREGESGGGMADAHLGRDGRDGDEEGDDLERDEGFCDGEADGERPGDGHEDEEELASADEVAEGRQQEEARCVAGG